MNEPKYYFERILQVLNDEELIRLHVRFERRGDIEMADIMSAELIVRGSRPM